MKQWISIKGISRKYQIDEKEVEELVTRKWVTYSEAFHTLMVDEKSFHSYLELHQQLENRALVIEKLDKLNSQLDTKLRVCEEENVTYVITDQLLPLYPFIRDLHADKRVCYRE